MHRCNRPFSFNQFAFRNDGFTLFEILMAVVLLAIAIAPIVAAYGPALIATKGEEELSVFNNRARGTLNRLMTFEFQVHQDYLDTYGSTVDLEDFFDVAGAEDSAAEAQKEIFKYPLYSDDPDDEYTPQVTIQIYDADGDDNLECPGSVNYTECGILEITVTVANVSVQTLKTEF